MLICDLYIDYCLSGSNIQHSELSILNKNDALPMNKFQGILPTNMLAYLNIISGFYSNAYMEDIYDMKC